MEEEEDEAPEAQEAKDEGPLEVIRELSSFIFAIDCRVLVRRPMRESQCGTTSFFWPPPSIVSLRMFSVDG